MKVVYYDLEKSEHVTINNVYSILDDKDDGFVTVCFSNNDQTREYSKDIPKECFTSINVCSIKEERDMSNDLSRTDSLCDKISSAEQEKRLKELATVALTYSEMRSLFRAVEQTHREHVSGYVVFTSDSFPAHGGESSRTYVISSNNKAYQSNMGGYSIYGSSLDGSDVMVRLEQCMASERGGKNGWMIERCYMKQNEFEKARTIATEFTRGDAR